MSCNVLWGLVMTDAAAGAAATAEASAAATVFSTLVCIVMSCNVL